MMSLQNAALALHQVLSLWAWHHVWWRTLSLAYEWWIYDPLLLVWASNLAIFVQNKKLQSDWLADTSNLNTHGMLTFFSAFSTQPMSQLWIVWQCWRRIIMFRKKSIASAVWTRHYADTKTSGSVRRCFCSGLFFFSVIWVKLQMSKWTLSHTPSLSNEYPLSFFCRISRSPLIKPGKTMRLKCKRFFKEFIHFCQACLPKS